MSTNASVNLKATQHALRHTGGNVTVPNTNTNKPTSTANDLTLTDDACDETVRKWADAWDAHDELIEAMEDYGADINDIDILESMDEYHDAIAAFEELFDDDDDDEGMAEAEEAWDRACEESREWEDMTVNYLNDQEVRKPTTEKFKVVEPEAEDEHFAAVCEILEEIDGWSRY
ncbi:hypothetical protein LTS18_004315 [Coniosporium uncinatum]|uniref:Uncharacterized protein n=1 Tax=Coniosporium uncinatum TaxID=93489 RepID=A0ACC3DY48_9PEZI|nr:hypothetical protein LTS18_004315 [Coniosporium uncinatum]